LSTHPRRNGQSAHSPTVPAPQPASAPLDLDDPAAVQRECVRLAGEGVPVTEIAARLDLHWRSVYRALEAAREGRVHRGRRRAKLTDAEIAAAYRAGEEVESIAERAGLHFTSIYNTLARLGEPLRGNRLHREKKEQVLEAYRAGERGDGSVYPTSINMTLETDALLYELEEWLGLTRTDATAQAIRELHARIARQRQKAK